MTRPFLLLALGLVAASAAAQPAAPRPTADDRFHQAARLFVAGDSAAAERAAQAGLAQAPADPRLRALLAELRRQPPPPPPQPQQGGGRSQDRPDPPQDPPPPQDEPQGGDQNRDRQSPPPRRQPPQDDAPRPQQPRPQDAPPQDRDGATPPRPGQTPPPATGDSRGMTRGEAEALLRALGADERRLLRTRARAAAPRYVEKDW